MFKSYQQLMDEMFKNTLLKTSIEDLAPDSIINTLLEMDTDLRDKDRRTKLIKFLAKLDPRFKRHIKTHMWDVFLTL